jgi:hypothetical protein
MKYVLIFWLTFPHGTSAPQTVEGWNLKGCQSAAQAIEDRIKVDDPKYGIAFVCLPKEPPQ